MTISNGLPALPLVLLFGTAPDVRDSDRPELASPQVPAVTCRVTAYREKGRGAAGIYQVRGAPQSPHYIVKFGSHSGSACLERREQFWPETFEMKISGDRDTILFVTLTPGGYGEVHLLFAPGKKWVNYYDGRGKRLDRPAGGSFRIETEETADGVDVTVTLHRAARSMRSLDVNYYSTSW
jgi:hypothetical protein